MTIHYNFLELEHILNFLNKPFLFRIFYSNHWYMEIAFRMSKSDLEIRPIYHFTKRRIEAHISISFVAYSVYKELERLLYKYQALFSVKKAREIIHNIYQLEIILPDSNIKEKILLQMDEEEKFLLNII